MHQTTIVYLFTVKEEASGHMENGELQAEETQETCNLVKSESSKSSLDTVEVSLTTSTAGKAEA